MYQRSLSRLWPNVCMYTPTCSAYAAHAIARRGLLWGGALAVWRILRCHPFCRGGYDPPPGYAEAERAADEAAAAAAADDVDGSGIDASECPYAGSDELDKQQPFVQTVASATDS